MVGRVSYKYRVHDPRIGRFLSIDPLAPDYPWNSPYAFSENKVIRFVELEGMESGDPMIYYNHVRFRKAQLSTSNKDELIEYLKGNSLDEKMMFYGSLATVGIIGLPVTANAILSAPTLSSLIVAAGGNPQAIREGTAILAEFVNPSVVGPDYPAAVGDDLVRALKGIVKSNFSKLDGIMKASIKTAGESCSTPSGRACSEYANAVTRTLLGEKSPKMDLSVAGKLVGELENLYSSKFISFGELGSTVKQFEEIERLLKEAGDGAMAMIAGKGYGTIPKYDETGKLLREGHVWNAVNDNGVIKYIDYAQPGASVSTKRPYKALASPTNEVTFNELLLMPIVY
jgi:hypothetical protein